MDCRPRHRLRPLQRSPRTRPCKRAADYPGRGPQVKIKTALNARIEVRTHRRGFTMPEMLGPLLMLGTFSLIATQVFYSGIKLAHQPQLRSSEISRLENAMRALRRDVWNAREMTS